VEGQAGVKPIAVELKKLITATIARGRFKTGLRDRSGRGLEDSALGAVERQLYERSRELDAAAAPGRPGGCAQWDIFLARVLQSSIDDLRAFLVRRSLAAGACGASIPDAAAALEEFCSRMDQLILDSNRRMLPSAAAADNDEHYFAAA
jgi:hypothetical protein